MSNRKDHILPEHLIPTELDRNIAQTVDVGIMADLDAIDDLNALAREAIANGGIETFIEQNVAQRAVALRCEAIMSVLSSIMHARRPKLAAWQIAFAAGLDLTENKTGPQCAAMFGMTKQAWFQGVDKIRKQLGINYLTPHTRDNQARAEMSKAYKRKGRA